MSSQVIRVDEVPQNEGDIFGGVNISAVRDNVVSPHRPRKSGTNAIFKTRSITDSQAQTPKGPWPWCPHV